MITSLIHNTNNVIDDIPSIRRSNQLLQLQGEQNKQQKKFKDIQIFDLFLNWPVIGIFRF